MVAGEARPRFSGSAKSAVRGQVTPNNRPTRRIGLNEVQSAIQKWNVNIPTGTLAGPRTSYNILASGQLLRAADYRPLVVTYRNGAPVRLEPVAHVIDSVEDNKQMAMLYGDDFGKAGTSVVMLAVTRQPGSNTIQVVDGIRALSPFFKQVIPPSVRMLVRGDRAQT